MIKVALADDNNLWRKSLKTLLMHQNKYNITLDASDGQDLLDQLHNCKSGFLPDVILLDLQMPILDGRQAAKIIREKYPSIKLLILSFYHHEHLVIELLQCGVSGFITKNIEPEELMDSIIAVNNNQIYIQKKVIDANKKLRFNNVLNNREESKSVILSEQQKSILKLCSQDYSYKEIANILKISPRTVHDHRDRLFEKLNINSKIGLIVYAIQMGLVDILENDNSKSKINK